MKSKIIGIACCSSYLTNDNIFEDKYYVGNNYIKPILKNGGIPIGLLYDNNKLIKESLKLCDAFIITGGTNIIKSHLEIIDYAIKHNKPILGICMGMQALGVYSLSGVNNDKIDNCVVLIDGKNHCMENPKRNDFSKTFHNVKIKQNSLLFNILKTDNIMVNSLHRYHVLDVGPNFIISAISEDGIIEAIEYKDKSKFILGVQWHPELLDSMNDLFKKFISCI